VASKTLPTTPSKDHPNNSFSSSQYLLLDAEAQNLLKVFSLTSEDSVSVYVLVFIAMKSSNSGGFFCLIDTSFDQFVEVGIIDCPKHTAHCHLQDFMVKDKTRYTETTEPMRIAGACCHLASLAPAALLIAIRKRERRSSPGRAHTSAKT